MVARGVVVLLPLRRIFTIDRTDFSVYRPKGLDTFEIVP